MLTWLTVIRHVIHGLLELLLNTEGFRELFSLYSYFKHSVDV